MKNNNTTAFVSFCYLNDFVYFDSDVDDSEFMHPHDLQDFLDDKEYDEDKSWSAYLNGLRDDEDDASFDSFADRCSAWGQPYA